MTSVQFTMVEELAFLIKDNLYSKHIVLSVEETLVDLLQNNTSSDGILELEPMNAYHRHLLHRLAEIYGFAHESVGEGDHRHLVLERCPDSSIPAVLVSDMLWQFDCSTTTISSHQLLRRKDGLPESRMETVSSTPSTPFEEREAAYLAARERIFSLDGGDIKESCTPKQRNIPVVAQRMIAHALGQKIVNVSDCKIQAEDGTPGKVNVNEPAPNSKVDASEAPSSHRQFSGDRRKSSKQDSPGMVQTENVSSKATKERMANPIAQDGMNGKIGVNKESLKQQHLGAAKRMFAHALGLPKQNGSLHLKCTDANRQLGLKS
ncbi:hypothetical protein H6P81_013575 [Aristolochia fimbriata]|uniref:R3H domain-containing protein n=1 Tax=Aristolochia fimbriata TaxID=158543 RepID=A0AAV7EIN9_ARIFI|nr:hypothetical protein H6P81_013575 [Aristolochia fimbriata]